jgi:hypothetical protein
MLPNFLIPFFHTPFSVIYGTNMSQEAILKKMKEAERECSEPERVNC